METTRVLDPTVGTTFVTAMYVPSTMIYRKVDTYISLFEKLASTGVPIILYMDTQLRSTGETLCSKYPNIQTCIYTSLDMSYMPDSPVLPTMRNVTKDTPEYYTIQLSKLKVLSDAATHCKTTHLAWIDFGIFHMFRDTAICKFWLQKIAHSSFPTDTILSPGCWTETMVPLWDKICWKHCGSFLLGSRDLFQAAYTQQMKLVYLHLPNITWEINYWVLMDDHFRRYPADHNELILQKVCDYICP